MRLLAKVERLAQTASTIFNIFDNRRKIERMSKQGLISFEFFRHAFDFVSTCFNMLKRGWQTVSTLLFDKIECMLKQIWKPFARSLSLNDKKACGPDLIPIKVMKMAANEIAPVLQVLFYQSMVTGSLPPDWLLANITPIFKKEKRSDPSNFRPISLTSMTCKLMERVICSEIMNHLETTNYLVNFQHGFRRNHSFESQVIITINDLAKTLDDGGQTDLIILDFSKAFDHDSASHQRLLHKLDHCGVRGDTINWICSLLTQRVVVNGKESEVVKVKSGVPQGTVLGPFMFLIYIKKINDIGAEIKSSIRLFADDCLL